MKSLKHRIFLFLIVLMSCMGQPLRAEVIPEEPHKNTDDNFYEIQTLENLYWVAQEVNAGHFSDGIYVRLMADIIINPDIEAWDVTCCAKDILDSETPDFLTEENLALLNDVNNWVPIGNTEVNYFTGEFDGNGHTISNLFYDPTDILSEFGLFGYASNANIHDFRIFHGNLIATDNCAPLLVWAMEQVNINRVTVEDSYLEILDYSDNHYAAGLVAHYYGNNISNIHMYYVQTISGYVQEGNFGEIVGRRASSSIIKNCYIHGHGANIKPNFMISAWDELIESGMEADVENYVYNNYYEENDYIEYVTDSYYGIEPINYSSVTSGHLCWLLNEQVSGGDTWRQNIATGSTPMLYRAIDDEKVYKLNDYLFANVFTNETTEAEITRVALNETLGFQIPEPINVSHVSYLRIASAYARWNTVCLPFTLTEETANGNSLFLIYNIAENANSEYVIYLRKVNEIPANTPAFVFRKTDYLNMSFDYDVSDQPEATIQLGGEPGVVTYGDFEFRGVYEASTTFSEEQTSTGRYFFVYQNGLRRGINPFSIKPFRAYLYCTKADMGAAPLRFTLNTLDEVSAIDALEDVAPHSQSVTDLMGRPVSRNAKGLLITNHKKLLVR